MAKPIKETPILFGKDSKKFMEATTNVKKADESVINTVMETFKRMNSIPQANHNERTRR